MEIPFSKFHGSGNDFIVTCAKGLPRALPALARAITNRQCGVGADGFIVVLPPRIEPHDARIRFFNADGSEPEMSGNGIRCVGAYLLAQMRSPRRNLQIETIAGVKTLRLVRGKEGYWVFKVGMGAPILAPSQIPFRGTSAPDPVMNFALPISRGKIKVTVTSMGNPHCTIFVTDFKTGDWPALGREIELHKLFPRRTNVEFVQVISRYEIETRFWERGVGQTMSSGTGSCGAVVACILNELTGRRVRVHTLAGELEVEWPEGGEVTLTGPAERVASGVFYFRS